MYIVYIIEERPKIFTLLKNIMFKMGEQRYVFMDGEAMFSNQTEKLFCDNRVIIFHYINSADVKLYSGKHFKHINLVFVGDTNNKIDMETLGRVDSIILNAENIDKTANIENIKQIITCGLREKDTVTFSSVEEDNIILNVQRTIRNIESENIEPFEKKIYIRDIWKNKLPEVMYDELVTALTVLLFCNTL